MGAMPAILLHDELICMRLEYQRAIDATPFFFDSLKERRNA